jgi:uncharacterized integral membrane protein
LTLSEYWAVLKKTGFILVAIAAIVVGLLVGTLNAGDVALDLLWFQLELPLGLAILLGFSLGLVMGLGMLYFTRVLPLRNLGRLDFGQG